VTRGGGIKRRRSLRNKTIDFGRVGDQQQNWLAVFPALELANFSHSRRVERIGAEAVKRVGAKRDDAAGNDDRCGFSSHLCGVVMDHDQDRADAA
jgi:hypothetical protein